MVMEDQLRQELSRIRARLEAKKSALFLRNAHVDLLRREHVNGFESHPFPIMANQTPSLNDIILTMSLQAMQTTQIMNMLATQHAPRRQNENEQSTTINAILEDDSFDRMLQRWRASTKLLGDTAQMGVQTDFPYPVKDFDASKDLKTFLGNGTLKSKRKGSAVPKGNDGAAVNVINNTPQLVSGKLEDSEDILDKGSRRSKRTFLRQKWRIVIIAILFVVISAKLSKKSTRWKKKLQPLDQAYRYLSERFRSDERLRQSIATIAAISKENTDMLVRDGGGFLRVISKRPSKWAITRFTHAIETVLQSIKDLSFQNLNEHEKRIFMDMLSSGDKLPRSFFWEKEREYVLGTSFLWPKILTEEQAIVLLIYLPLVKVLIGQMLMKSAEIGSAEKSSDLLDKNLKVFSLLLYRVAREACSVSPGSPWVDIESEYKSIAKASEKPFVDDINTLSDGLFKSMYKLYDSTIKDESSRLRAWAKGFWIETKSDFAMPLQDEGLHERPLGDEIDPEIEAFESVEEKAPSSTSIPLRSSLTQIPLKNDSDQRAQQAPVLAEKDGSWLSQRRLSSTQPITSSLSQLEKLPVKPSSIPPSVFDSALGQDKPQITPVIEADSNPIKISSRAPSLIDVLASASTRQQQTISRKGSIAAIGSKIPMNASSSLKGMTSSKTQLKGNTGSRTQLKD